MQIGNLRHRYTAQLKAKTKAPGGEDVHTWSGYSPELVRTGSPKPLKGEELVEARREFGEQIVGIRFRYDPELAALTNEDRFIMTDQPTRVLSIHAILNEREQNKWLDFWCSEGMRDIN